ncbi:hypothetical protein M885DRAFT_602914 [Pelagophyceae sp. CCMP2097]|nr:hypothetical protein M885DRAFT_602914 [Pelagophyceae sp. CCMP2097]
MRLSAVPETGQETVLCSHRRSYISVYVRQTRIVRQNNASLSLLLLWVFVTLGRLLGLYDQIKLKSASTRAVFVHLVGWLLTGTFGMMLMTVFNANATAFWVGVALYGLGNGPCVGYCYDLVNRMTVASEEGMSIVMFGLNFGASLVPYVTTVFWDRTAAGAVKSRVWKPGTLVWATLLTMLLPIPLLLAASQAGGTAEAPILAKSPKKLDKHDSLA